MTDRDLEKALDRLTASVGDQRVEIAKIGERVGTLQDTHEANAVKLDRVLELELTCPSRAGWKATNARLKNLETGEKLRVESELQAARDEITGQVDVMQRRAGEKNYSETPQARLIKFAAPYAWKGLLIFGIAIGGAAVARCAGDDQVATARSLQAVTDMIRQTAADVEQVKAVVDEVASDTESAVVEPPTGVGTTVGTHTAESTADALTR